MTTTITMTTTHHQHHLHPSAAAGEGSRLTSLLSGIAGYLLQQINKSNDLLESHQRAATCDVVFKRGNALNHMRGGWGWCVCMCVCVCVGGGGGGGRF